MPSAGASRTKGQPSCRYRRNRAGGGGPFSEERPACFFETGIDSPPGGDTRIGVMNERDPHLMPIGRFSEATRLSVKALRLYDEMGLLTPDHVDASSGYRYYGPAQATRAEAIRLLRNVDMPLEEIAKTLSSTPEKRNELMSGHLRRLEDQLTAQQRKLAAFTELAEGRKPLMPYDVKEKEISDQHVASITSEASIETVGAAVGSGFGTIMTVLGETGVSPAGAPFLVMHEVIDEENAGPIEICIPVAGPFQSSEPVESKLLPGGTAATTIHKGPYQEVGPAYHAISQWMSDHGWEPNGPPREIYLNDPTEVTVSEQLTEVVWPMHEVAA